MRVMITLSINKNSCSPLLITQPIYNCLFPLILQCLPNTTSHSHGLGNPFGVICLTSSYTSSHCFLYTDMVQLIGHCLLIMRAFSSNFLIFEEFNFDSMLMEQGE